MRLLLLLLAGFAARAADYPAPKESDFVIHDFRFKSGETLPELKLHYTTLGSLNGDNAVLILHGKDAPVAKPDCVRATVQLLKLESEPFERIFEFRASSTFPATAKQANDIFAAYMDQIERVIEAVDKMVGSA